MGKLTKRAFVSNMMQLRKLIGIEFLRDNTIEEYSQYIKNCGKYLIYTIKVSPRNGIDKILIYIDTRANVIGGNTVIKNNEGKFDYTLCLHNSEVLVKSYKNIRAANIKAVIMSKLRGKL